MPYLIIFAGFIFLLYVISRFMKQSNSPRLNRIFRYGFAAIVGGLAFLILIRGNIAAAGILGLLSFLSAQGSLWRFFVAGPARPDAAGPASAPETKHMTREEALDILGLYGNPAQAEIKNAHHKMMLKLHPDQGGSDYLATKINQARDTLLG